MKQTDFFKCNIRIKSLTHIQISTEIQYYRYKFYHNGELLYDHSMTVLSVEFRDNKSKFARTGSFYVIYKTKFNFNISCQA